MRQILIKHCIINAFENENILKRSNYQILHIENEYFFMFYQVIIQSFHSFPFSARSDKVFCRLET